MDRTRVSPGEVTTDRYRVYPGPIERRSGVCRSRWPIRRPRALLPLPLRAFVDRFTAGHHRRPGVARCGGPAPVPGPVGEVPSRPGHAPPVAPRARGRSATPVPPARSSSAPSLDQRADPSSGKGEPQVGLPQDQGGAPEARGRRLGNRHGASSKRPRPGATPDRPDLDTVPQAAGVRPSLTRPPVRGGRHPGGRRIGSARTTAPDQRRPSHDRA